MKQNTLDQNFESFLSGLTFKTPKSELTPEHRRDRRAKADIDDIAFCEIYFPNIFNEPMNEMNYHIASLKTGKYTVSGCRKYGKSTSTYIMKIIKSLCLGIGGIINLSLRTKMPAEERTASFIRIIKKNKKLMYDYDIKLQQDKKGYYIVNNTILIASSVETGLRSIVDDEMKRIKISVNDDLYNKNSVASEYDNQKVFDFITSEIYGQMEDDGLCITLGNSISETCPIVKLKTEYPQSHYSLPATDENGNTNWPGHSRYDNQYWVDFAATIPFDIWMGEYMDQPLQKGEIFDIDWIRGININLIKITSSLSAIDPATGKTPSACFKGIATLGLTDQGMPVCLDMYTRREDYSAVFDYVDNIKSSMPNWQVLLFENDFNQYFTAQPYYLDWQKRTGKVLPIQIFNSKDNKTDQYGSSKEQRIMNLVHPHQTGQFYYNENILKNADFKRYKNMYISFGKTKEKVDSLDALATAFIMIRRWVNQGSFKSLKMKTFFDKSNWFH